MGPPRLLADIGGTRARLGLEVVPGRIEAVALHSCDDFPGVDALLAAYLRDRGNPPVCHAAIAIANPVAGDAVRMTNRDWSFSVSGLQHTLGFSRLVVMNDMVAMAMALPRLAPEELHKVGDAGEAGAGVKVLLGPGTGLGVGALVPLSGAADGDTPGTWMPVASEGGHVSFAPADETECRLLEVLWRRFPHVSAERIVSGTGIPLLHSALCVVDGVPEEAAATAEDVVARARADGDSTAARCLSVFSAMLGGIAGNLALAYGARGGVYLSGGVIPRLGELFDAAAFRRRFEAKGRFAAYLAAIPVWRMAAGDDVALRGAAAELDRVLQTAPAA